MADAYDYGAEQQDSQDREDLAKQISRCVAKLKGSSRNSQLRVLLGLLEQLPQDVAAIGSAKARETLLQCLSDRTILHSKKDIRMYAAACFAQLLRIYAPETPYEDKQLEPVFDLLLWSIEQIQEYQAPSYELAVSVLQTISQTKSYFIMLDWGRDELILDWVRALLQCINGGSSALAGPHALEVLLGIVNDEAATEAVLEMLLSHLVPPRSQENPQACQLAQAVLKACEATVKPALQKYLTTLILSPISSNSDLHQQCYTLIYQLYMTVPQVMLPVIPHLTSELHSDDPSKRQEACQLLGRLLSLPGNKLVNEYRDVLDALLKRYADGQVNIRLTMLDFTSALVAAAGSEELQQQVLSAAAGRLLDFDDKVRVSAVKAVCQTARQLLVGPPSSATAAPGPNSANTVALLSPVDALLGSIGSQELTDAAAADLDLATAADLGSPGPAVPAAAVRDLPFVQEALKQVLLRLRDTKPAVRKAAAGHFLAIFRAVVAAGEATQAATCSWLAARVLLCCKTDKELRVHVVEVAARDGLMGPKTPPVQAAAAWVRVWLRSSELEREALTAMINTRSRLQVDTLQFLALRRKLSGRQSGGEDEPGRLNLEQACVQLAQQLPQPDKALEAVKQLLQVRDNNVFAAMQAALAPGASQEAYTKGRSDALARVGSRSQAAEAVGQLLLWGRPAAWLTPPIMRALLELVACEPQGEQAELVQGAYKLLLAMCKAAPLLTAGLLLELHQLAISPDTDLQQLGVQLLARCAAQMRKCGMLLSASTDTATAALVQRQLLPSLRCMSRAQPPTAANSLLRDGADDADGLDSLGLSSQEGAAVVAPKAAKWAVFGLAACQDSSSSRRQLEELADELAGSLDAGAADTAAKLQALAVVGRLVPDALARHVEALLHFVTEEYFNSYVDAAAGAADMQAASSGGRRRSLGGGILSPLSPGTSSLVGGSQAAGAAGLLLKCAALKALAAACVPDSDNQDAPVETLRVVGRLAEFLEGLLEPEEELRPAFLSDASPELCGQLRLSAAVALLRLARRHDTRLSAATYCALALTMQDDQEAVRAAFAAKVYRLVRFFMVRPSAHQLSAKYAAMLPLAAADPSKDNKDKAARMLRVWVHERRATVQAHTHAAARGAAEGGSTLQELPEMMLSYGLHILAHHPDFPQGEDADDPQHYTPFQHMLQFMLQPLLVASSSTPAGAMAPVLLKICRTLKRTEDAAEPPATTQLYSLSDMASLTLQGLAASMKLQLPGPEAYGGAVVLPCGLFKALDRGAKVDGLSYLPPGYEFIPDPEPAAALAAPANTAAPAAAAAAGRGTRSKAAAQAGGAGGRGSKRKAAGQQAAAVGEVEGHSAPQPKRPRAAAAAGGKARSRGRGKAAAAAAADSDGDDGWGRDSEDDAPPSAQKEDQLTRRQQVLRQQHQLRQQAVAPFAGVAVAADEPVSQGSTGSGGHMGDGDEDQQQQQQERRGHQPPRAAQGRKQPQQSHKQPTSQAAGTRGQQQARQLKQQQLTFAAAAAADASSPAPVRRSRQHAQALGESPNQHVPGGSSSGGGVAEGQGQGQGSSGESPFAALANGVLQPKQPSHGTRAGQDNLQQEQEQAPVSKKQRVQRQQQQPVGQQHKQAQRQGLCGAAAAAVEGEGEADGAEANDGDVALAEDQEQAQPAPKGKTATGGRGTAVAASGGGGTRGQKVASGATRGAAAAPRRSGRATRQKS